MIFFPYKIITESVSDMAEKCNLGWKKEPLLLMKVRIFHFSFNNLMADEVEMFIFPLFR